MHKQHRRTRLMFSVALFVGFTLALAGCAGVESPVSESPIAEFNASTEAWAGDYAECLRDAGYVISDPPSKDEWVEGGGPPVWSPSSEIIAQESDVEGALQICPEPNGLQIEERMHELRDSQ